MNHAEFGVVIRLIFDNTKHNAFDSVLDVYRVINEIGMMVNES